MWFLLVPVAAGFYLWKKKPSTVSELFGPFITYGPPVQSQIDTQALALARSKIEAAEGYKEIAYLDSRGILTVGIGHRVTAFDSIRLGEKISAQRVQEFFNADIKKAFDAAKSQAKELGKYTPQMIAALTSVNFQLGTGWRSKFKNTWSDLKNGNVNSAISRLNNSDWKEQTPTRVTEFITTLQTQFS